MVLSNISSVNRNMTLSFGRCLDILSVSIVAPADRNTIIVCDVFTMLWINVHDILKTLNEMFVAWRNNIIVLYLRNDATYATWAL